MASMTPGYSFGATEQVTNTKIGLLVSAATISAITDADIDSGAAISDTKLDLSTIAQAMTFNGTITGASIHTMSSKIFKLAKGADVASTAGTITLGDDGNYFDITGTAAITSITAKTSGTVVTLQFDSTATLTDGSNLKLNGSFTGAAEAQITLVSDGTNWFEVCRNNPTFTATTSNALSKSTIQTVITKSSAEAHDAGVAVYDDTPPLLAECPNIAAFDTTITASSASNTLIITLVLNAYMSAVAGVGIAAIFLDAATTSIAAAAFGGVGTNGMPQTVTLRFSIAPADTSAHTYKLGLGGVDGIITLNGADSARKLGGVLYSSMTIEEIKA